MNAQSYTTNFQNNNLSGTTKFLENYKSSKTRVCVTVGMMTTGYDCEDLLNIGLLRPIFSPTDFIQIKGRGTRKYQFAYKEKVNEIIYEHKENKDTFKLFDFFGNCEYFEEKFNYDEVIKLPKPKNSGAGMPPPPPPGDSLYENYDPDPLKFILETPIGFEGMKIDRMFFDKFESKVKEDETARQQYEQGNYAAVQHYIEEKIMNKPSEYYTWEKIKRSIGIDRRLTVKEILDKIFGAIPEFKSKRELIEDEFESYLLTRPIQADKYTEIKRFFETYIME
jgi:type I restriction enzyme R subunit